MNRRRRRVRREWSKRFAGIVAGGIGVFGIWSAVRYYELVELAITTQSSVVPDASVAVTCVQVVIAALLSYLLYQAGLKHSRNKYGIDADGQPFRTKINESTPEDGAVG